MSFNSITVDFFVTGINSDVFHIGALDVHL